MVFSRISNAILQVMQDAPASHIPDAEMTM